MSANHYRPTQAAALIVSPDAMRAALLAAAIELGGVKVAFPLEGEAPRDTVRRLRPSLVLIDVDDTSASDEALIGPAMMTGARIFLFGGERRITMHRHLAQRFHLGVITLPNDVARLAAILALPSSAARASEPLV